MNLTNKNYFSPQAEALYFSASQCKAFLECEAKAASEYQGTYKKEESNALLMGSYVDAYFSGEIGAFLDEHPDIFTKAGRLKSEYRQCEDIIERVEKDPVFMRYLYGDKQQILTGEIFGYPFKAKIDVLNPARIVDLKLVKDLGTVWKHGERVSFVDAWQYDLQGFIYQQMVAQNFEGDVRPFYLACITKETVPDYEVIHIPDWKLNSAGEILRHYLPRWNAIKRGEALPDRCGVCDYCKKTKRITGPIEYEELLNKEEL